MRLLLAFVYIATGMWLYFKIGGENFHLAIGIAVWFALMFSSVIVCNEGFLRKLRGISQKEYIQELLQKNLAVKESYEVREAVTFEDMGTGSLCHILRVGENKSVCLYGQYLYEYSEIDDDPELNQKRMFPTSLFSVVRKRKNNQLLTLDIGGKVIDEFKFENVNVRNLHELGIKLEDGEIIENIPFVKIIEALK